MITGEFCANWNSIVYTGMSGSLSLVVSEPMSKSEFAGTVRFRYDAGSSYSPGKEKVHAMNFICDYTNKRVSATMKPGSYQMITLTISFERSIPVAYYSSVFPIDCGSIKLLGDMTKWFDLFKMPK